MIWKDSFILSVVPRVNGKRSAKGFGLLYLPLTWKAFLYCHSVVSRVFLTFFLQIELFQGNDIRVMHIPEINDFSAEKQTFSVRIHEDSWMRADRLLVNREHLLMALADVDFILIRATDSKGTKETAYELTVFENHRKSLISNC